MRSKPLHEMWMKRIRYGPLEGLDGLFGGWGVHGFEIGGAPVPAKPAFVASGGPLRDDILVRTDAASVKQCLDACLPRLRELGFTFPE